MSITQKYLLKDKKLYPWALYVFWTPCFGAG